MEQHIRSASLRPRRFRKKSGLRALGAYRQRYTHYEDLAEGGGTTNPIFERMAVLGVGLIPLAIIQFRAAAPLSGIH